MIDAKEIRDYVEGCLAGTDLFLVDVKIKAGNLIEVEIDSDNPVSIEACEKLTREIEERFDRDVEDYTLEVGSAGITSPFKVRRQYDKYVGREVETTLLDGKKLIGILKTAGPDTFTIISKEKVKKPEMKRPVIEDVEHTLGYNEVRQTKYLLKF